jgi:transposase-like protein
MTMRRASERVADSAEKTVRGIRRATRRRHSAEDKIRIVEAFERLKAANDNTSPERCED